MHRRNVLQGLAATGLTGAGGAVMAKDRFFVPAEEARHELTFMQWPVSRRVYPDPVFLEMVQGAVARIANVIVAFEPVILLADARHHDSARRMLSDQVALWDVPTEDLWCRDSGPIFVTNSAGDLAVRHIQFNGWGNRQVHRKDGRVADRVARRLGVPVLPSPLKGEAGGIEQDGHGLLMAHESSWVNDNRNPGLTRDQVGAALLDAYGADRLIWAPGLRDEDITDFHIDALARFTAPGRVLMNLPPDPDRRDPFHQAAAETHDILRAAGLDIDVIKEPRRRRVASSDFVASYVNYYVCNGAVIGAQFGDTAADQAAEAALRRHYPGREIVNLNVDPIGEVGGGIHCATQQMPAV